MKKIYAVFILMVSLCVGTEAQSDSWQQQIKYAMDVQLDVQLNKLTGTQQITYTNHSPDTLNKIFIHLFWNAFTPGSMMDAACLQSEKTIIGTDARGNAVTDYDRRFKKRIADLTPAEQGWCRITKFLYNGKQQRTQLYETILKVMLDKPVLPNASVVFNTEFESQVPLLCRRSGRDNAEGIRYSMGQWYPKIAEYDKGGWHPDPYIAREFYGVWGDYDVSITLDKNYKLGATGVLQNKNAIAWGYDKEGTALKQTASSERTWMFSAKNIHDFVWAADPGYKHITRKIDNGPLLHFVYKDDAAIESLWNSTADTIAMILPYLNKTFGNYPYPVYSFLHGGGGGTEYALATLIRNGSLETAVHELCHSWYQMMLGTNENLYAWMDEGFTDYAEAKALACVRKTAFTVSLNDYDAYRRMALSKFDEPMSTPANYFKSNYAYNTNSYYKGAVFLYQLGYIVGEQVLDKIMLEYHHRWAFRHPEPNDFIRVAEKLSGLQLDWYKDYMLYTNKTIDYAIDSLWEEGGTSKIRIKRIGQMPMPVDVLLTFKDGSTALHYIPLSLMLGEKPAENQQQKRAIHPAWSFVKSTYVFSFKERLGNLSKVSIDPGHRMADMDERNNLLELNW